MTAITKNVAQQSFFRFICFQIHIYGLTCNVSRIHKKYFYMQRVKMAQGTLKICLNMQLVKTTRGGATTRGRIFLLLPILDQMSLSDFVSLMIENTKLLHIRAYVCEQSLLGSGTGLSLVSL